MNRSDTYSASGSVDAMVVGFEKIEEVDGFAARIRIVPVVGGPARMIARRAIRVA